jgi:NAD(P)H dehydrogenase (quinone)
MNISLILAHPAGHSFNHAIAATVRARLARNGHEVIFHDLCAERFDPILPADEIAADAPLPPDIRGHCNEISRVDGIVIVHPNWWGQPPAILKGWVDRVIRPGVAYKFVEGDKGEGVPVGLLNAKSAVVFNTSNTPLEREMKVFGDPLQLLWKNCIFDLCGVTDFHREMFTVVVTSSYEERQEWLKRVERVIEEKFPAPVGR